GSLVVGGGGNVNTDANSMKGNGTLHVTVGAIAVDDIFNSSNRGNMNVGINGGTVGSNVGLVQMEGGTLELKEAGAILAVGNGGATSVIDIGRNNGTAANWNLSGTGQLDARQVSLASSSTAGAGPHNFTMTGGTLNVTTFNFGTGASTISRTLSVGGGTAKIG